jgi:hypothetical protein
MVDVDLNPPVRSFCGHRKSESPCGDGQRQRRLHFQDMDDYAAAHTEDLFVSDGSFADAGMFFLIASFMVSLAFLFLIFPCACRV